MAGNTEELIIELQADLSDFRKQMGQMGGTIDETSKKGSKSFAKLGSAVKGIGVAIASATAAVGAMGLAVGGMGIKYNAELEQASLAFDTLLGSADKSKKMIEDLQRFGATTPFEFMGLQDSAKLMLAMGFEAESVMPMMQSLGDAVSAVGGNEQDLNGVVRALGQMNAKGKVSAEEMNQLAERGIGAWGIMEEQLGKSKQELMKMSEQGKLMADDVLPHLIDGMGKKYAGAMDKQSQSFSGLMSTLKDEANMMMGEVSKPLFELIKGYLPQMIEMVGKVSDAFKTGGWKGVFEEILPRPVFEFLTNSFNTLQVIIGTFNSFWSENGAAITETSTTLFSKLGEFFKFIQKVIEDVSPVVIEITTWLFNTMREVIFPILSDIISFIKELVEQTMAFWNEHGEMIMESVKNVFTVIKSIIDFFMPAIQLVISVVLDTVKNIFQGALDVILGAVRFFSALFTGNWSEMWEGTKQILSGAVKLVLELFKFGLFAKVGKALGMFAKRFVGDIVRFGKNVGSSILRLKNNVVKIFNNLVSMGFRWGMNLINGFKSGITRKAQAVVNSVKNMMGKVKDFIGFNSPSKKGDGRFITKWGQNMVLGFIDGVDKGKKDLEKSSDNLFKAMNLHKKTSISLGIETPNVDEALAQASYTRKAQIAAEQEREMKVELSLKGGFEKLADEIEAKITNKISNSIGGRL